MGCLDDCQDNAEPVVARVIRSIQKWRPKCVAFDNPPRTFTFNPDQKAPKRVILLACLNLCAVAIGC